MEKVMDKTTEEAGEAVVKNTRNFRTSSELVDFYRFVYESSLRTEAHLIFETVNKGIIASKKKAKRKSKAKH